MGEMDIFISSPATFLLALGNPIPYSPVKVKVKMTYIIILNLVVTCHMLQETFLWGLHGEVWRKEVSYIIAQHLARKKVLMKPKKGIGKKKLEPSSCDQVNKDMLLLPCKFGPIYRIRKSSKRSSCFMFPDILVLNPTD